MGCGGGEGGGGGEGVWVFLRRCLQSSPRRRSHEYFLWTKVDSTCKVCLRYESVDEVLFLLFNTRSLSQHLHCNSH